MEDSSKLFCGPPCFLLVHYGRTLKFLVVHCSSSNINPIKAYPTNFAWLSNNMACLFTESHWSLHDVIMKQYWRVFYSDFEEYSNNYYFSNIFSPSPLSIAHQRTIFKFQKPVEILIWSRPRTSHFCQKIWIQSRDSVPLKKK